MKIVSIYEPTKNQLESFYCGQDQLNDFLWHYAKQNDSKNLSKTYVGIDGKTIVGYFSITCHSLNYNDIDPIWVKHYPKYPIPCVLLTRLAIDKKFQKKGYGRNLTLESFSRVAALAAIAGCALLIVCPKKESINFYERIGFRHLKYNSQYWAIGTTTLIKMFIKKAKSN